MKVIILMLLLFTSTIIQASSFTEYCYNKQLFKYSFVNIDKNKIIIQFKNPIYNSPIYIYNDQIKVSITPNIKFWIFYNDKELINYTERNKIEKYDIKLFGTLRIKIP